MRALRQSGSIEGAATAKLIKRGIVELNLMEAAPASWGKVQIGGVYFGSNRANIVVSRAKNVMEAAGVASHEARHVMQRLTARTYRKIHEFEAYQWTKKVDRGFLLTDEQIWDLINTHYPHVRD